ncbi:MAG: hypothetical protein FKGGLIKP_00704 [Sodalis sp. Fse]|nr:MAG: hypothetical protein FKGGLIKP_00704 [Sodalis sp. Fse]UVK79289.1 MAG: hypothetical protein IGNPGNKH_00780 [Sodalis sp. Ffu]
MARKVHIIAWMHYQHAFIKSGSMMLWFEYLRSIFGDGDGYCINADKES